MSMDSSPSRSKPAKYEIQLQGHISQRWTDWLGNLTVIDDSSDRPGISKVTTEVVDQAALLGLLQKMHNLGHSFLEIRRLGEAITDQRSIK